MSNQQKHFTRIYATKFFCCAKKKNCAKSIKFWLFYQNVLLGQQKHFFCIHFFLSVTVFVQKKSNKRYTKKIQSIEKVTGKIVTKLRYSYFSLKVTKLLTKLQVTFQVTSLLLTSYYPTLVGLNLILYIRNHGLFFRRKYSLQLYCLQF